MAEATRERMTRLLHSQSTERLLEVLCLLDSDPRRGEEREIVWNSVSAELIDRLSPAQLAAYEAGLSGPFDSPTDEASLFARVLGV